MENRYDRFYPGALWRDTEGKPIQAHGFSVFYDEAQKLYYWYGENKEKSKGGLFNKVWHWGVRCYKSEDLYNWQDMGLIIPPDPEDLQSPLHPTYCMDRPHILYCKKTGKYVAWLKIMVGLVNQCFSILTADRFEGPYTFVRKLFYPLDMDAGDFCLYADPETEKAYLWFERPHFQLVCATLDDTYTGLTGEHSVHYDGQKPPATREAPAVFKRDGKYYLFTSGTTGYYPNPSTVAVLTDPHGAYTDLGDPCIGDSGGTTFNSQITCVLQIPDTQKWVACADRWMPHWWVDVLSFWNQKMFKAQFRNYQPDMCPRRDPKLTGKEQWHSENTAVSRYVWLPVQWEGEKPVLRWQKQWRWEAEDVFVENM